MRNGKSIRERLTELGLLNPDPDEAVHDLLDLAVRLQEENRGSAFTSLQLEDPNDD